MVAEEQKKFERINTIIHENSQEASYYVAQEIVSLVTQRQQEGKKMVLGLATGSTPIKVYEYLVQAHKEEGISFSNVISFNLDEYFPMDRESVHSYVRFMREHLFDHLDIPNTQIHIPDGQQTKEDVRTYCQNYEQKIIEAGGIDIQILGIGRTGHIGFNEPGSSLKSKTRLVRLDRITRLDAASDFFGKENVPSKAITMGVGTIMDAKRIVLMAWGEGKANIIKQAVEGPIQESVPATFLQTHPNCDFIIDRAAATSLTREATPWLVGDCDWTEGLIKKATIWLSETRSKAVLKLTNEDYNEYGMGSLIAEIGSAEELNVKIFNQLQQTITGWPGGKPQADDTKRPERANPFPKKSIVFSPHPDDDVISMGGTLLRLVDQGHEVHVAYQTSGNIAVFDDEVIRFLDFAKDIQENNTALEKQFQEVKTFLSHKSPGEVDQPMIQKFKGLIRKGEAMAACRYCGVKEENAHFQNLPFYETGTVKKNPYSEKDIALTYDLLNRVKPQQIFAAGDLSDPHGTHRVCLDIIFAAIDKLVADKATWIKDCYVWLYRGAWQEWDIADMEMAVPIGPKDMIRKRNAIFKHQSQKDAAMFPGSDEREFWQRAEDRNRETAKKYNALGLAEYEAMEGFVRYKF
ncbi:MAG: glucosamine-6-phosphate deaminase [Flavobacteriaceae bacterium]|jgi:glucosamine-6-phosphate deaminase|nr:glucosamine-6-phosphate deaminase [Flavobacteriaceae bacterium]MCO4779604.1 glucosamine-6-phosphate deaminase [Flavobacteriaceae bacterium]MCO4853509.1 glucosamine-6-phosphate deaminase [Flavobacteriaceae bacterium]MDA9280663.1 glucosamine-6-phosphate deaminase [Flavobacteriaceae bacterium]MDC1219102.1 glucosamine-6-phosphate deaminase [Flavobacteriaceae bacterium]|tara:strand:- start:21629 stop:23530 length:1902 start_codon:yes stop_codon:yes gene_type:complete